MRSHRPLASPTRRLVLAMVAVVGYLASATTTDAFAPIIPPRETRSSVKLAAAMNVPPPPGVVVTMPSTATTMLSSQQPQAASTTFTALQDGVQNYVIRMSSSNHNRENDVATATVTSNSVLVSLQERKVPTAEEIAQKKLNFNLLFWGGGFVAPFLATVFYFGTRFWEK